MFSTLQTKKTESTAVFTVKVGRGRDINKASKRPVAYKKSILYATYVRSFCHSVT